MGFTIKDKITKEKEKSIYNVNELSDFGYLYDSDNAYVPYPNKENPTHYLGISRTESKKSEIVYSWVKKNDDEFDILTVHKSEKLVSEKDSKLTEHLQNAAENAGIELDDTFSGFVKSFRKTIIQSLTLEVLKNPNFVFPKPPEDELEAEIEEPLPQIKPFKDYPKLIRTEALKIINDGRLFDELINSISLTHEGNKDLKKQLILILASVFIDEPVHTELNADTGVGKTDIIAETSKNFPNDYVHVLRTVSPKNIYYDRESYGDYNIIVFDDVVLTDSIIEVIKELADNNKKVKELKTVYDGKSQTFTLPGKFLVILTYAKANPDEELLNRLYKLNIIVKGKDEKSNIKHAIKDNALINADNNKLIDRTRYIMQAAIQYLVEQNIQVFNPFVTLFDPTTFSNRNIKAFVSLVKSRSFFHTNDLKSVEIMGQKIYIGSYKDYEDVVNMWADSSEVQQYKLNAKQLSVLDLLPSFTSDEAHEYNQEILEKAESADTLVKEEQIKAKLFTRRNIANATGINENSIQNYLDYSKGTAKTLMDYGLIGRRKLYPDKDKSPWTYYKIKRNNNVENTLRHNRQIENEQAFDTLYYKIKIIMSFLLLSNISINKAGYDYLENYCMNYSDPIKLDDYDSYYNFIKCAIDNFDVKKYANKLDQVTHSDLVYISNKWSALKKLDDFNKTPSLASQETFDEHGESESNVSDNESGKKSNVISEMTMMIKGIDSSEIFNTNIDDKDLALKVCALLFDQNMDEENLFDKIYGPSGTEDPKDEIYNRMQLNDVVYHLEMEEYIFLTETEYDCYQLSEELRNNLVSKANADSELKDNYAGYQEMLEAQSLEINDNIHPKTYKLDFTVEDCQTKICERLSQDKSSFDTLSEIILPKDNGRKIGMGLLKKALRDLESANKISKNKDGQYYLKDSSKDNKNMFDADLIVSDYGFRPFEL
ncbi:hypothetical protein [Methanobrevibacter sp.]|uniref:hypothetical protein n=1 Tax=Methanobrevibacter sp. TaxID=66852 RepID=UPI00386BB2BD